MVKGSWALQAKGPGVQQQAETAVGGAGGSFGPMRLQISLLVLVSCVQSQGGILGQPVGC